MNPLRLVPGDDGAPEAGQGHERRTGELAEDEDGEEDEGSCRRTNIVLALAMIAVIATGIWLVNALLEQRRIDDCMAQGRRNCGEIDVPAR